MAATVNHIRLCEARRAMRALLEDPDDTAQAFKVIAAMTGSSGKRLFERFRRSPMGTRILREERDLLEVMGDMDRLRAMPSGSLGQSIADFYATEQLSAQGLVAASEAGFADRVQAETGEEERIFRMRLRDLHDVFHVLAGYGRDLRGETAVLAFTLAQTRNPGIAYIVLSVLMRAGFRSELGKLVRQGFRRGLRAKWLLDQDWEALLPQPIDELRGWLRVGPPPVYEQIRSAGAPVPRSL
ncbi:MAG: Coq4 family protein [Myxococcota bacterium]|jgi:ubiquinone biosynthesis protein COQ4|nr:hypothetical protein [Deltaproteobacteria bacterium]MCP4240702.1 hypothetical protein [bacterium]MDP6243155.1 Coq4 family protein [Myxococcota bacterium]MDP7073093.1 Coq4 family protein [Myxococcota bacterium]MDP7299197.1 Coq4 family protein [Myxococcota bacterium]